MKRLQDQKMDAHERVEYLIKLLGKNPNSFADAVGVVSTQIYHIVKGNSSNKGKKNKPSFDLLAKICEAFPQVNMNWLLTGKGNPVLSADEISDNQMMDSYLNGDFSRELVSELKGVIKKQEDREKIHLETISNLSKRSGN